MYFNINVLPVTLQRFNSACRASPYAHSAKISCKVSQAIVIYKQIIEK